MKAIVYRRYATPPALEMADLPAPTAGPGEVLVRVEAASLNPMDIGISSGAVRAISGNNFPKRLGADFSGEVVGRGDGITDLQAGDEVFGYLADLQGTNGTFAEYLAVKASRVALKPKTQPYAVAAAMPCVYQTALQGLRDVGRLRAGDRVLLYGASGGVGTAAVQLAKHLGAHVTTVSSDRTRARCLENGADVALAYDQGPVWDKLGADFDLIFQVYQTKENLFRIGRQHLTKGGRFIVSPRPKFLFENFVDVLTGRFRMFAVAGKRSDLDLLARLVDDGKLSPRPPRAFVFDDFSSAFDYMRGSKSAGKTVLAMAH
jgi:NADPH:quinone reductase-like Zn-dependent oxidoreductase